MAEQPPLPVERGARPSPRGRRMVAVFGAVDKLPAWAGVLVGVAVGAPLAYAAQRWLPVWAAYGAVAALLAGATALAWSGKPVSRVVEEPPPRPGRDVIHQ